MRAKKVSLAACVLQCITRLINIEYAQIYYACEGSEFILLLSGMKVDLIVNLVDLSHIIKHDHIR